MNQRKPLLMENLFFALCFSVIVGGIATYFVGSLVEYQKGVNPINMALIVRAAPQE